MKRLSTVAAKAIIGALSWNNASNETCRAIIACTEDAVEPCGVKGDYVHAGSTHEVAQEVIIRHRLAGPVAS